MTARAQEAEHFVASAGWAGATFEPLSGDASFRRYFRVSAGSRRAIVMDAPPDREDVKPFLHIAAALREFGYSAPTVLAADPMRGFLLLEDLGDDLFNVVLAREPAEAPLYDAAVDLLRDLHGRTVPDDVPHFGSTRALREVRLFCEWTLPALTSAVPNTEVTETFMTLWEQALVRLVDTASVLCLFDYHAENLIWLPQRIGLRRVGLLDFQDAVRGPAVYDLVSLLEDARRDVSSETVDRALSRYLAGASTESREIFLARYALAGAQRNTRILGVFGRLFLRDDKAGYLALMPRVWRHLENDLRAPHLADLRDWFDHNVPVEIRRTVPSLQTFVAP
jgi:aminoglycoside/choline kinase family phosphotransferase